MTEEQDQESKLEKELKDELEKELGHIRGCSRFNVIGMIYHQNRAIIAEIKLSDLYQTQTLRYLKKLAGE